MTREICIGIEMGLGGILLETKRNHRKQFAANA